MPTTNEDFYATLKPPVGEDDDDDIHVRMVGAVGDNIYSELLHTELKKNGVNTSGRVTIPGKRSSVCFVTVERFTGENTCLFTLGATEAWKEEDFMKVEDLAYGSRPDLVIAQMEISKEVVQQMIETAGKAGINLMWTPTSDGPETSRHTHLLFTSKSNSRDCIRTRICLKSTNG